jgi:hypothetical protein
MNDESVSVEVRHHGFPDGFFTRRDEGDDRRFYGEPRLVQHIDDGAIAAVRDLYEELGRVGPPLRTLVRVLGSTRFRLFRPSRRSR